VLRNFCPERWGGLKEGDEKTLTNKDNGCLPGSVAKREGISKKDEMPSANVCNVVRRKKKTKGEKIHVEGK